MKFNPDLSARPTAVLMGRYACLKSNYDAIAEVMQRLLKV